MHRKQNTNMRMKIDHMKKNTIKNSTFSNKTTKISVRYNKLVLLLRKDNFKQKECRK